MLLVLAIAAACAEVYADSTRFHSQKDRRIRAIGTPSLPHGCLYEGRWFTSSSVVTTHEACLHCVCARGALACRRRACAVLPDPPPKRCHVLHRRGACCPELHCPNSVTLMEHGASARFENDDFSDIATPASIVHACVEGGTVYSAGSAMESATACEQCFCLGGARRCVRPRCLPPPPGCRARPAPGACCPQRYYCDHVSTRPPERKHLHDCEVKGSWVPEGERVVAEESGNCTRCFCLRGSVLCQPLACAPPLLGCKPLLRPGQCCPHQYHCDHSQQGIDAPHLHIVSDNILISTRSNDRSFHPSKLNEIETSTKAVTVSANTTKSSPTTVQQATKTSTIPTTKVKRKTNDPPPVTTNNKQVKNITTTTKVVKLTTTKPISTIAITTRKEITTEESTEITSTEQPEETIKIMINGTINCTAELSSTSIPLNISANDTEKIMMESMPKTPDIDRIDIETQTSYPNDIITDRNVNGGFDENESFVINVTSSLRTNTSLTTSPPILSTFSKVSIPEVLSETNNSKKTKGDYDYDYTEPTLPPSLPNLKIIPFVAADAVVDDDVSSKESMSYPMLEREDKFPVYYPSIESKESLYATRREDKYPPTQYPVFVSEKIDSYPTAALDMDLPNSAYPTGHNDLLTSLQEFAVSASLGNHNMELNNANKVTTKPSSSSTFAIKTPAVNLFSPPVETEGGFVPKGPGIIDEYYAVYPSTKTPPSVPHLTTSMQLDISKESKCLTGDGRHVPEGDSVNLACSVCTCAWGELHCSPRACLTPPGCQRKPASISSADLCCGELICDKDNSTKLLNFSTTEKTFNITEATENKIEIKTSIASDNKSDIINNTAINTDLTLNNEAADNITFVNNNNTTIKQSTIMPNVTEKILMVSSTENTIVTTTYAHTEANETKNISQEYEEEEEDDDGYFFGNVLKYILSDNYDTTITPYKKKTTLPVTNTPDVTKPPIKSPTTTTTTRKPSPKPTLAPFVPMPHHQHIPYAPPKKTFQQNTVNRIDHLVLGEATAIKRTTPRPVITSSFKPKISSYKPYSTSRITTQRPIVTTKFTEITKKAEPTVQYTPSDIFRQPPSGVPGLGPGLLKLAGCNIYGRMYRVGRIIAELSTPCQECWCTEIGVQCKQLAC